MKPSFDPQAHDAHCAKMKDQVQLISLIYISNTPHDCQQKGLVIKDNTFSMLVIPAELRILEGALQVFKYSPNSSGLCHLFYRCNQISAYFQGKGHYLNWISRERGDICNIFLS